MNSMTGIGRSQGQVGGRSVRIEIKSLNHRGCEVNVRAPSWLKFFEFEMIQFIKSQLHRGSVDVYCFEDTSAAQAAIDVESYVQAFHQLMQIKAATGCASEITIDSVLTFARQSVAQDVLPPTAWADCQGLLARALTDLKIMRAREGADLDDIVRQRFAKLGELRQRIMNAIDGREAAVTERLKQRVQMLIADASFKLDEVRLHQEVAHQLDRADVTEELERLQSHFKQALDLLALSEPLGRKFDFLLQEIQREFNTITNKAQDAQVSHLVVEAKSELEKVREQIQNIE